MTPEIFGIAFVGAAAVGAYFAGRSAGSKQLLQQEKDELRKLKEETEKQIEAARRKASQEIADKQRALEQKKKSVDDELALVKSLSISFRRGYIEGRKWLADYISEFFAARTKFREDYLRSKKQPAVKTADALKEARAEIKQLKASEVQLRYELQTFKEYFPFLETFEQEILEDKIEPCSDKEEIDAGYDRTRDFLSADEYARLDSAQRSQLALDRYKSRPLSKGEIGRFYERFLGYIYETKGFEVEYFGINQGLEDLGRDLICRLLGVTIIVQAKCWSAHKVIREKHIYQLFGTITTYSIEHPDERVEGHLYTTTELSPVARAAAERLNIEVHENFQLDKSYPMIKCNIGRDGSKRYHLPFDQQYDRTKILAQGERYVATAAEAEKLGFTRAKRHAFKG